jgi:hypothetical protein
VRSEARFDRPWSLEASSLGFQGVQVHQFAKGRGALEEDLEASESHRRQGPGVAGQEGARGGCRGRSSEWVHVARGCGRARDQASKCARKISKDHHAGVPDSPIGSPAARVVVTSGARVSDALRLSCDWPDGRRDRQRRAGFGRSPSAPLRGPARSRGRGQGAKEATRLDGAESLSASLSRERPRRSRRACFSCPERGSQARTLDPAAGLGLRSPPPFNSRFFPWRPAGACLLPHICPAVGR